MPRWSWWIGLVGVGLAALPPVGFAQPIDSAPPNDLRSRSHVPIPPRQGEADPAALLALQMRRAQGMSELRELVQKFLEQNKGQLPASIPRQFDPNDPELRKLIEQMLQQKPSQLPSGVKLPEETRKRLQEALRDAALPPISSQPPRAPEPPAPSSPSPAPSSESSPQPPPTNSPARPETPRRPGPDPQDRAAVAEKVRHWFNGLENMHGRWSDSPTARRLVHDLARLGLGAQRHGADDSENLETQLARLHRDVREARAVWEKSRSAIDKLNLPALPRFNWSPRLSSGLPSLTAPRIHVPDPTGPAAWDGWLWLGGVAALALAVWKFWGRGLGRSTGRAEPGWKLGAWPVRPEAVTTRADLVQAFEYLSLLLCGPAARSWNHREIAARLGGDTSEERRAADDLATVYEQARYAPEQEPLPGETLSAARRDLCFLAGVAAV